MIPPVRKFALKRVRQLLEEGTSTPVLSWTVKKVLQAKRKLLPGKIQNTKYKIQNTKYIIQNTKYSRHYILVSLHRTLAQNFLSSNFEGVLCFFAENMAYHHHHHDHADHADHDDEKVEWQRYRWRRFNLCLPVASA